MPYPGAYPYSNPTHNRSTPDRNYRHTECEPQFAPNRIHPIDTHPGRCNTAGRFRPFWGYGWVGFGSWGKSIAEIKKYNRDDNNYAGLPFSEEDFPMKQVNTDNLAFSSILNSVPQPEEEEFHLNESYINKSVSSGTLRPEDVIPAMAKVLEFEAPTVWKQLEEDEPTLISEYIHALERNGTDWRATRNEWFESERGDEFNEVLENILNDIAPEGCYFGHLPVNRTMDIADSSA